jgi:hypothetical protein
MAFGRCVIYFENRDYDKSIGDCKCFSPSQTTFRTPYPCISEPWLTLGVANFIWFLKKGITNLSKFNYMAAIVRDKFSIKKEKTFRERLVTSSLLSIFSI